MGAEQPTTPRPGRPAWAAAVGIDDGRQPWAFTVAARAFPTRERAKQWVEHTIRSARALDQLRATPAADGNPPVLVARVEAVPFRPAGGLVPDADRGPVDRTRASAYLRADQVTVAWDQPGRGQGVAAVGAEPPTPEHPFDRAWETWQAWSTADTMRLALRRAREQRDHQALADFAQHPEWTHGPGPTGRPARQPAAGRAAERLALAGRARGPRARARLGRGRPGAGRHRRGSPPGFTCQPGTATPGRRARPQPGPAARPRAPLGGAGRGQRRRPRPPAPEGRAGGRP